MMVGSGFQAVCQGFFQCQLTSGLVADSLHPAVACFIEGMTGDVRSCPVKAQDALIGNEDAFQSEGGGVQEQVN